MMVREWGCLDFHFIAKDLNPNPTDNTCEGKHDIIVWYSSEINARNIVVSVVIAKYMLSVILLEA